MPSQTPLQAGTHARYYSPQMIWTITQCIRSQAILSKQSIRGTMNSYSLSKTYNFKATEERIYSWWQEQGYFEPSNDPNKPGFDPAKKPWVLTIPPPNITGSLHLGHAMFVSMEDLMTRYNRMKGIPTLWVPGTDHASIATQLQVENMLMEEGLTREAIGREAFLERCWEWRQKYGGIITRQIRRLGASCDWSASVSQWTRASPGQCGKPLSGCTKRA